ncbi:MAG: hypothetical protein JKY54_17985 [Flavobacteriales bacterium]|nr:hypothetical protein [Flavobacteriales bacterium]
MKKLLFLTVPLLFLAACGEVENHKPEVEAEATSYVDATLCNCLDSIMNVNQKECDSLFPVPITNDDKVVRIADALNCGVELIYEMDTILSLDPLPEPTSIDEVLTMDVPDPISDECREFLGAFGSSIKKCTKVINKAAKNPDDFMLLIDLNDAKDELREWSSKPQMFKCDDNDSFKHLVEKLNEQKDKLLSE